MNVNKKHISDLPFLVSLNINNIAQILQEVIDNE